MTNEPSTDDQHDYLADAASLRDAVTSAGSSPAAVGWQTEQWLGNQHHMLHDLLELLAPESIQAEMRVRGDVPRLLAQLAAAVRSGGR